MIFTRDTAKILIIFYFGKVYYIKLQLYQKLTEKRKEMYSRIKFKFEAVSHILKSVGLISGYPSIYASHSEIFVTRRVLGG